MVVGNGLIASQFYNYKKNDSIVIFASGVSNSGNTQAEEFEKEFDLLHFVHKNNQDKKLVYFSTCSITDGASQNSAYVKHKIEIENRIKQNVPLFTIFRLSNPIGKNNNPNTVFNFFVNHIISQTPFTVWKNAYRNILDIDDMYKICHYILSNNLFVNDIVEVANPSNYRVTRVINEIENYFEVLGRYNLIDKGSDLHIHTAAIAPIIKKLSINFDENYITRILTKYFPKA